MLHQFARNWWALALRGVLAILFGVLAFAMPLNTVTVLVWLFGAYVLVDGIFACITAVRAAGHGERWGFLLFEGILGILAGIITFAWPAITVLTLLYLIAFWAIFTGALEIAAAIRLRKLIENEWMLALTGGVSLLLGILLILAPAAGLLVLAWMIAWMVGAYAILFGLLLLGLAFRLRRHMPHLPGSHQAQGV
ncbi:MAG TPA: HdeD family acid-resistance protein [Chthonomonadaceae bacterium]|nr:HdeD family acid-resistance protein [Chthonomonadaceae bacterium]